MTYLEGNQAIHCEINPYKYKAKHNFIDYPTKNQSAKVCDGSNET